MWLVLTTALRGDGLIGLIASDRLGWTSYRKTAARCGSLLAILYVLLSFFPSIVTLHLLFPHYRFASLFASFYLINSVFISSCLQTVCFFTLSHFFPTPDKYCCAVHKLHCSSQTWMPILSVFPSFYSAMLYSNDTTSLHPLKPHTVHTHVVYLFAMWPRLSANHQLQACQRQEVWRLWQEVR